MRAFLHKWFSGTRFWLLLATFELIQILAHVFYPYLSEVRLMQHSIVMWLSFATAEIITTINAGKSDNP